MLVKDHGFPNGLFGKLEIIFIADVKLFDFMRLSS
jgi:hypothetical protein